MRGSASPDPAGRRSDRPGRFNVGNLDDLYAMNFGLAMEKRIAQKRAIYSPSLMKTQIGGRNTLMNKIFWRIRNR